MRKLFFFALLCLAGCTSAPRKPPLPTTAIEPQLTQSAPHQKALPSNEEQAARISHWKAEGRIAATKGKKGGNASFVWQQNGEHHHIKLFGPFGSGAMFIIGNDKGVEVRQANGKVSTAATPEQLLQKIAGLHVPITGLQYWMTGQASPLSKPATQRFDKQGRLLFLQQEGWQIHYEGYQAETSALPNRIRLKNNEIVVKVVIKSWKKR